MIGYMPLILYHKLCVLIPFGFLAPKHFSATLSENGVPNVETLSAYIISYENVNAPPQSNQRRSNFIFYLVECCVLICKWPILICIQSWPSYVGPQSLWNRTYWWRLCVVMLPFRHFCWYKSFCHRNESDLFIFFLKFIVNKKLFRVIALISISWCKVVFATHSVQW